jgi:hypothetical protein
MFTPDRQIITGAGRSVIRTPSETASFGNEDFARRVLTGMKWIIVLVVSANGLIFGQGAWQRDFQKNHFTAGLGVALPGGDLKPFYKSAFGWSVAYGYRPVKWLQADFGYDGAYNAADVNAYQSSGYGPLRIADYQTFIPLGGRVVLPLAHGRVELYGGGGGAYARYSESLRQPDDYTRIGCPSCQARDGWGYYAMVGGSVALDAGQRLRLGVVTRAYRVETKGAIVGVLPSWRTDDRWLNTYLTLTASF